MTLSPTLFRWRDPINHHFPNLTKPQATALALWSVGMILARSATLNAVYLALAEWLEQIPNTMRQRLRDWYLPAACKSGCTRRDWNPASCFGYLITWVRSRLPYGRLLLAIDASSLKDNLTVLSASVLTGGCAIPVAWRCLVATKPGAWTPHWQKLIQTISEAIPSNQSVIVLADRGLWSRSLYESIIAHKWHPLLRINGPVGEESHPKTALFRQEGTTHWRPVSSFAPRKGHAVSLKGDAFKSQQIPCTLVIFWGAAAEEPWYLITDKSIASGRLYGKRFWIEHQFKKIKSDGWHWEKSRITDPERADRMWLAYAVGMLWTLSFGCQAEQTALSSKARRASRAKGHGGHSRHDCPYCHHALLGATDKKTERLALGLLRSVERTVSWFARGIARIAAKIHRGDDLECPIFRIPKFQLGGPILKNLPL